MVNFSRLDKLNVLTKLGQSKLALIAKNNEINLGVCYIYLQEHINTLSLVGYNLECKTGQAVNEFSCSTIYIDFKIENRPCFAVLNSTILPFDLCLS